jgi:hypothetical protein
MARELVVRSDVSNKPGATEWTITDRSTGTSYTVDLCQADLKTPLSEILTAATEALPLTLTNGSTGAKTATRTLESMVRNVPA